MKINFGTLVAVLIAANSEYAAADGNLRNSRSLAISDFNCTNTQDECGSNNTCVENAACENRDGNNFCYKCSCPKEGYIQVNPASTGVLSMPLLHEDRQFQFAAGTRVPATNEGIPVAFRPLQCIKIDPPPPEDEPPADENATKTNNCNAADCSRACVKDADGNSVSVCAAGYSNVTNSAGGCIPVNPCTAGAESPCGEGAECIFLSGGLNDAKNACDTPGFTCVCPTPLIGGEHSAGCTVLTNAPIAQAAVLSGAPSGAPSTSPDVPPSF